MDMDAMEDWMVFWSACKTATPSRSIDPFDMFGKVWQTACQNLMESSRRKLTSARDFSRVSRDSDTPRRSNLLLDSMAAGNIIIIDVLWQFKASREIEFQLIIFRSISIASVAKSSNVFESSG
jgi:hypothetical protein